MYPNPVNFSLTPKKEVYDSEGCLDSIPQSPIDVSSSSSSSSDDDTDDEVIQSRNKQLVLYEPPSNVDGAIELASDSTQSRPPSCPKNNISSYSARVLPSVAAFTVQCASCFKWRLIPTKEKYEEIRESITEQPFYCEVARKWKPDVSCDDPEDISQDGSRLWAIDKPNIAQPPPGWQRLLRIRGEGSTKFADIYYVAPSGKRLRSIVEIQKYLMDHPEYIKDGVTLSRFSFQIPKPLQEDYVRKRPARFRASCDGDRSLESGKVNPLAYAITDNHPASDICNSALLPPCAATAPDDPNTQPRKRHATAKSETGDNLFVER